MLKQIKKTEKDKANTFTLNVQQNKIKQNEKKEILKKNTNINLQLKKKQKKKTLSRNLLFIMQIVKKIINYNNENLYYVIINII